MLYVLSRSGDGHTSLLDVYTQLVWVHIGNMLLKSAAPCAQASGGVDQATLQAEAVPSTEANLDDLMAQLKALG